MDGFTGLVPAICSLCRKKKAPAMQRLDSYHGVFQESSYGRWSPDDRSDASWFALEASNPTSERGLVRQSSVDQLMSRSSRDYGGCAIDVRNLTLSQRPKFWNPIPHALYAKLKKRVRYSVLVSSPAKVRSQRRNKLCDPAKSDEGPKGFL